MRNNALICDELTFVFSFGFSTFYVYHVKQPHCISRSYLYYTQRFPFVNNYLKNLTLSVKRLAISHDKKPFIMRNEFHLNLQARI